MVKLIFQQRHTSRFLNANMVTAKVKKCVGAFIYNERGEIFLMTSPKWQNGKAWNIPGGAINKDENGNETETPEEALKREIMEEMGIELERIEYLREFVKPAGDDFYKKDVEFHFLDFIAKAKSDQVIPNEEIAEWKWFPLSEVEQIPMMDTLKKFFDYCKDLLKERINELRDLKKEYETKNY